MAKAPLGRVVFRVEGNFWNAYYARTTTMDGAILIGSLSMSFVRDTKIKEQFMALARDCISLTATEVLGFTPDWADIEQAPEHERAGRA